MWENYGDLSSEAKIVNSMLPVPGLCYLGHIQPILTVYGIPVYARPGQLTVTITSFPANAVTMLIYGSGLGTGANPYKNQPLVGGMLTGLFNLGVPALMLAVGTVNQFSETLQGIIEDAFEKNWVKILTGIGAVAITIESIVTGVYCHSNWQTLESIGEFLFQIVWSEVMAYMAFLDAEEEIEDQIPFLGWCMVAINIAAGIAQITETIVEVAESPWNIENHVSITITTTVNHHPDPRSGVFPAPRPNLASTYQAKMIFQNEQRPTVMVKGTVPSDFTGSTLQLQFPNNTLGGTVKFEAEYYIGEWIAAKATSAWMANNAEKTAAVDLTFIDIPIPLTAGSSYAHAQLLTYDNGSYGWTETGIPPSTTRTSIPSNPNNQIWQWNSLALSQRNQSLGSAWSAAGMGITECGSQGSGILYAMQNVKIPGEQSINAVFPSCGFSQPTVLPYDSYPPKFGMIYDLDSKMWTWALGPNGQLVPDPDSPSLGSFYLDPRKTNNPLDQDGGAHLRQVSGGADTTPFNMAADQLSWGRFPVVPDAMVLHPSGNIVGINTEYGKIFVLKGAPAGVSDDQALMARAYAGQATNAERPGLTFRPVGVCCSSDGTIFVLENGTAGSAVIARVQAFDLHSNPVSCFYDSGGQPTPFLNLSNAGPLTFIDVACVGDHTMTYLFVIAYASDGNEVSQYQVAVYQVASDPPSNPQPLFTASGVPAARLAVDMWHSMYTLNYGMTTNSEGQPAGPDGAGTGPAGRTVPSVSRWLPSN
jgi:hypothetical protein